MKKLFALLLSLTLFLPGCGSLVAQIDDHYYPYAGTSLSFQTGCLIITHPIDCLANIRTIPFIIGAWIDLPISFVYDTLTLPWALREYYRN